jgi:hypothetical protein
LLSYAKVASHANDMERGDPQLAAGIGEDAVILERSTARCVDVSHSILLRCAKFVSHADDMECGDPQHAVAIEERPSPWSKQWET